MGWEGVGGVGCGSGGEDEDEDEDEGEGENPPPHRDARAALRIGPGNLGEKKGKGGGLAS